MPSKTDIFTQIAREHLHIETLETRRSDRLDFHNIAVWAVANALEAAYRAGQRDLLRPAERLLEAKDSQMETIDEWRALRRAVRKAQPRA